MAKTYDSKNRWKKWYVISILIFGAFMLFSIYNDLNFFDFSSEERIHFYITNGNPNSKIFYIITKITFAIFIYWVRGEVLNILWEIIVDKNKEIKRRYMVVLSLLIVYCSVIILVYPGIWWANDADEFTLFSFNQRLQVQYHQGFFSSLMFLYGLMVYPKPVFIVLFQAVIGACVLGNIIYDEWVKRHNRYVSGAQLVLAVSPACLYFVAYPVRAWMFSVFFLAFLYKLYQIIEKKKVNINDIIKLTVWGCLIINYRTEIKFLMLLYPIILYLATYKKGIKKSSIIIAEIILIISVAVIGCWNYLGNQATKKTHSSLFLIAPLGIMLNDTNMDMRRYEEELEAIGKVFKLDVVKESNGRDTAGEIDETEFTEEEYNNFLKSIIKIHMENPKYYIKSKWNNLLDSLGMTEYTKMGYEFPEKIMPNNIAKYFHRWNVGLQRNVAHILAGQFSINGFKIYYITFAFWLPTLIITILFFYNIKKQSVGLGVVFFIILCQLFVTAFFAPVHYQMYYFPIYLTGWFFSIICVESLIGGINYENYN